MATVIKISLVSLLTVIFCPNHSLANPPDPCACAEGLIFDCPQPEYDPCNPIDRFNCCVPDPSIPISWKSGILAISGLALGIYGLIKKRTTYGNRN